MRSCTTMFGRSPQFKMWIYKRKEKNKHHNQGLIFDKRVMPFVFFSGKHNPIVRNTNAN